MTTARTRSLKTSKIKTPVVTVRYSVPFIFTADDGYMFIADQDYYVGEIRYDMGIVSTTIVFDVTICADGETPATGETIFTGTVTDSEDGQPFVNSSDSRSKIFELLDGERLGVDITSGAVLDGHIEVDLIPKNPKRYEVLVI